MAILMVVLLLLLADGCKKRTSRSRPSQAQTATTSPANVSDTIALGVTHMIHRGSESELLVRFAGTRDKDSFQHSVKIVTLAGDAEKHTWEYSAPIGSRYLTAIYPKWFGHDIGNLLCIEWDKGAVALQLTIIALDEDGQPYKAFDDTSRFGFAILDVTGDRVPDICGSYGDLGSSAKTTKVFTWAEKRFVLRTVVNTRRAHVYDIRED